MSKLICIVDNNTGPRRMMRFALSMLGLRTVEAELETEALDIMARQRVDMLVVDMDLPGSGGLELVRRLRRTKEGADMPVILVCSRDYCEARLAARSLEHVVWLKRPFRISDIEEAVTSGWALNGLRGPTPSATAEDRRAAGKELPR